jgi:hypothetical protein
MGENIMANNLILGFLIAGGVIGWSLFAVTLAQLYCNRRAEINMINEIKEDLKIVKQEVKNLK